MDAIFDQFENYNLIEVRKESFDFEYSLCKVWKAGECIFTSDKRGKLSGKLIEGNLHIDLATNILDAHVLREFSFQELSVGAYYKLWRTDTPTLEIPNMIPKTPMFLGLYYLDGRLAKVDLNIYEPSVLIDFLNDNAIDRANARFNFDLKTLKKY
jgi:hypothetical protein